MKILKNKLYRQKNLKKGTLKCPRLSIFRSNKYIYAQIIDDITSNTILSYSTNSFEFKKNNPKIKLNNCKSAEIVGQIIAKLCLKKGIKSIVFDRRSYLYHGRVKALAESARLNGLVF